MVGGFEISERVNGVDIRPKIAPLTSQVSHPYQAMVAPMRGFPANLRIEKLFNGRIKNVNYR